LKDDWNIVETSSSKTNSKGYRFYPDKVKGEGLFLACFQKLSSTKEAKFRPGKLEKASSKEKNIIQPWLKAGNYELIKDDASFFAMPPSLVNEYSILNSVLNVQYKGTGIGQIMKDRLVPEHALALSTIISGEVPFNGFSYEQAIKYLQKQDVNLSISGKGWQLASFENYNLGWVNVLPNRINNYYPKEFRILKQQNDSAFEK